MAVRCKFKCNEKTEFASQIQGPDGVWKPGIRYMFKFSPVREGSAENVVFFDATPNGTLELSVLRGDLFEVTKEYYLDLEVAQ